MSLVQNIAKRELRDGDIALGFGLHHLRSRAALICYADLTPSTPPQREHA